jgi:hypothetical protein
MSHCRLQGNGYNENEGCHIGDELQAPKADGFAKGKSNAGLMLTVGNDDEFR